jgi:hypothetical protein
MEIKANEKRLAERGSDKEGCDGCCTLGRNDLEPIGVKPDQPDRSGGR